MQVHEVMGAHFIRIRPDTKVREALQTMMRNHVDGAPVVDDRNQVVGILTYADLLRFARRNHPRLMDFLVYAVVIHEEAADVRDRFERILNVPVTQICTHQVVQCRPDDEVTDVAGFMVDHRIKRVPVVSTDGVLVGVISREEVMRAIWESYSANE